VIITGTGFTGTSAVTFNGTTATYTVTGDTQINTSVPNGASTGPIKIFAPGGNVSSSSFTVTAPPTAPHIMLIVEENHSYSGTGGVIGNSQAPFINSLAQTYLSATSWYAPFHGSPLDYMSLLAGNTDGSTTKPSSDTTLADELTSKGITWGGFMEAMPSSCDTSNWPVGSNSSTAYYAPDHNPFIYYASTRTTAACQNNVPVAAPSTVPAGPNDPFATLMSSSSLPDFMFVVPDNCDEMHSECPASGNNEPSNADAWMKYNMPAIQASNWYKQGGVVIITWDEAYHTDDSAWVNGAVCPSTPNAPYCGGSSVVTGGNVPTIVVSAATATLSNHSNSCGGNLYGILRGIEETYGVGLLSNSANTGNGDLGPAITSPNTGCITGTVTDGTATGHPVLAGVTVTCTCQTGAVTTNSAGNYVFSGVPPASYSLTFTNSGDVTQTIPSVAVTTGNTTKENAALIEDGSITGQVTDSSTHAAIANATVTCTCQTGNVLTNSTGNYTFTNIAPATAYTMTFSATGHATTTINNVTVVAGQATTENAALGPALGGITGTVTDATTAGHPVLAGVTVACSCTGTNATTNSSGVYTFSNIASGSYSLTFSDAGYVTQTISPVVVGSGTTTQPAALIKDGTITGTVTDSVTKAAINGAAVACSGTPSCTGTTTATDGTYTLTVAPGSYTVTVTETGYTMGSQSGVGVTAGNPTTANFSLVANPGTISGAVTDSLTHAPIAGATVGCTGTNGCTSTTTAGDGTYSLPGLPEGSYQVTASAAGYTGQTSNPINVGPGGTPTQNFALAPLSGTISGTVFESDGTTPINAATVACTGTLTCTPATTGSSGTYTLSNLPEGSYQITASMTGFSPQTLTVVVGPGATVTGQNFQLNAATATLNVAKSFGSATSGSTGSTTLTATSTSGSTGPGDLLAVIVRSRTSPSFMHVTGITDSSGSNTWVAPPTKLIAQKVQADEEIWYLPNAASVTSVTVTMSGTTSIAMTVLDITGTSATPLDQAATATGTSTAASTGATAITTDASEIVVAAIGWNGSESAGFPNTFTSGFTTTGTGLEEASGVTNFAAGQQSAWEVLSTTGTPSFAGTLSASVAWTGVIATFH
jgi:hypothetical protein